MEQKKFGNQLEYKIITEVKRLWGLDSLYKQVKSNQHNILYYSVKTSDFIYCQKFFTDFGIQEYFKKREEAYNNGVNIPKLIRSKDQSLFKNIKTNNEKWRCCVYEWIPGQHIDESFQNYEQLGREVSKMHEHFVHGDLHKQNIIVNNNGVYFIDIFNGENYQKEDDLKELKANFPQKYKQIERGYYVHNRRYTRVL